MEIRSNLQQLPSEIVVNGRTFKLRLVNFREGLVEDPADVAPAMLRWFDPVYVEA
jgi:hypothetical protein